LLVVFIPGLADCWLPSAGPTLGRLATANHLADDLAAALEQVQGRCSRDARRSPTIYIVDEHMSL